MSSRSPTGRPVNKLVHNLAFELGFGPRASPGIRFNKHIEGDGPTVFAHACRLGLEGVVSKRKDSAYCSDSPSGSIVAQLVQAMAGFGVSRGAADGLNAAPLGTYTSQ